MNESGGVQLPEGPGKLPDMSGQSSPQRSPRDFDEQSSEASKSEVENLLDGIIRFLALCINASSSFVMGWCVIAWRMTLVVNTRAE